MLAPDQLVDSCSPTHISSFARQSRRQSRPAPPAPAHGRWADEVCINLHMRLSRNDIEGCWNVALQAARELPEPGTGCCDLAEAPACAALQRLLSPDWNGTERTRTRTRHAHAATSVTHLSLNWTRLRLPPETEASLCDFGFYFGFGFCFVFWQRICMHSKLCFEPC